LKLTTTTAATATTKATKAKTTKWVKKEEAVCLSTPNNSGEIELITHEQSA